MRVAGGQGVLEPLERRPRSLRARARRAARRSPRGWRLARRSRLRPIRRPLDYPSPAPVHHGPSGLSFDLCKAHARDACSAPPMRRALLTPLARARGRRCAPAGAPAERRRAAALGPARTRAGRPARRPRALRRGRRRPHDRRGRLRTQRRALARAGFDREAAAHLRRCSRRSGPAYRIRNRACSATGAVEGATLHGDLVLKGYGDPIALERGSARAWPAGARARDSPRHRARSSGTSRSSTRAGRARAGSRRTTSTSRRRSRLSPSTAGATAAGSRGTRRSPPRSLFRERARAPPASPTPAGATGARAAAEAELATHRLRRRYSTLLRAMNRESDNFTAELLLKHLGAVRGGAGRRRPGRPSSARTLARRRRLARRRPHRRRLGPVAARPADGATRSSTSSPPPGPTRCCAGSFLASLAVAGRSGTLERPAARAAGARATCSRRRERRRSRRRCRASSAAGTRSPSSRTARPSRPGGRGRAQDRFVTVARRRLRGSARAAPPGRPRSGAAARPLAGPSSASTGPGSSPTTSPVVFARDRVGDLRAQRLERRLRLVPREALQRAGDHVGAR